MMKLFNTMILPIWGPFKQGLAEDLIQSVIEGSWIRQNAYLYEDQVSSLLPQELLLNLKAYVEDSLEWLVLVSFGSWVVISEFVGLPYRFIMKSDKKNFESLPTNVLIYPWIPVNELLSHRKAKLIES